VIGVNSLTLSGAAHRDRRAVLHRTLAAGLGADTVPRVGALVRSWIAALAGEKAVDAHGATSHLSLRVICAILFGPDALSRGDEALLVEAVQSIEDDLAADIFRALPRTPWARARQRGRLAAARQVMSLVVERTRRRATAVSLLHALEGLGLAADALRDEILLILLAGHHTTGTAAAWMLFHIAADPALAADLAAEAERMSGADGEVTGLSVRSAALSRALALEVLRLYPSTYWMSREIKIPQVIAGCRFRRGASIVISQWHLHRDPRFWDEPERLKLDRNWLANPAYMPFGFGGRACVGMNVALIELQLIALEFESRVLSAQPPAAPKPSVTLVPPPLELGLAPRWGVAGRGSRAA
jgi:cytochrome P450